jgi:type II secretory ATPase GspE/PulE/Tfp pilus assembly ATPase PilB-like protein
MINNDKIGKLGIRIVKDKGRPHVLFRDKISSTTKSELDYLLGSNVTYEQSYLIDQQTFTDAQALVENIDLNVDNFATDEDIYNSAKIALQSEGDAETPVIALFNNLISVAILRGASDIHINPKQEELSVKMRFDGNLTPYVSLDRRISQMLSARIKLLSGMDITERRRPQDGRFSVVNNGKTIDIRSASMPTKFGERLTLRIFNQDTKLLNLEKSGLAETHVEALKDVISSQNGIVIVCGPTGSGKTTTIYSLINELTNRGLNIMTIEDPIEIELESITQTQVNEDEAFTFAHGLKSLLRNDPDVILVGEIRDAETAEIAVRAAMTGHLVITTIHANSPISAVKRLINLGVDQTLLSDCLKGVFSQRLIKVYCKNCHNASLASASHTSEVPQNISGCEICYNTGFKSRMPVMSHLIIDEKNAKFLEVRVADLICNDTMAQEAGKLYKSGRTPLFEILKIES